MADLDLTAAIVVACRDVIWVHQNVMLRPINIKDARQIAEATDPPAAPLIERAALQNAANRIRDESRLQSSWFWYELGETAIEKVAQRLELWAKELQATATDPLASIGRTGASRSEGETSG